MILRRAPIVLCFVLCFGLCPLTLAQAEGINTDNADLPLGANNITAITIQKTTGNVGIQRPAPVMDLDINGGLKIGNVTATCTTALAGTFRWNGTSIQGCNGSSWQTF